MAEERSLAVGSVPAPPAVEHRQKGVGEKFGSIFQALWTATACAILGDGVYNLVLPVLATTLTKSPGLVAAVTTAITMPWLLFSLPVGYRKITPTAISSRFGG